MAAAIVPLIAGLAPEIINLIAILVHQFAPAAEVKFGSGTGPVKFGDVFAGVMAALNSAAVAGQIPKELPSDELVKIIIQAVVSAMKLGGALTGAPSQPTVPGTAAPQSLVLGPGQKITIEVAG